MDEAERCTAVGFIESGHLLANASPRALIESFSTQLLEIEADPMMTALVRIREQGARFDAEGPPPRRARDPGDRAVGKALAFSVSPFDAWSAVGATSWSFGDGGGAAGTAASHAFGAPGTYTVTVMSVDALGNASAAARPVTITSGAGGTGTDGTKAAPARARARDGPGRRDRRRRLRRNLVRDRVAVAAIRRSGCRAARSGCRALARAVHREAHQDRHARALPAEHGRHRGLRGAALEQRTPARGAKRARRPHATAAKSCTLFAPFAGGSRAARARVRMSSLSAAGCAGHALRHPAATGSWRRRGCRAVAGPLAMTAFRVIR